MGRYSKKIHIGQLIDGQIKRRGMSYAHFARQLHCDRTTVYNIIRAKSIDTDRLMRISDILDYDFIGNVYSGGSQSLKIEFTDGQIKELGSAEIEGISILLKPRKK